MKVSINHNAKEAWFDLKDLPELKDWIIYVGPPPQPAFKRQSGYEARVGGIHTLAVEVRIGPPSPPSTPCCSCCCHKPTE